jgi:hypothetical protein
MPYSSERSWPDGLVHLLLQAVLAPEAQANAAWRAWKAQREFDDVTWPEMRLLAPLSLRLAKLDPDTPLRPRIDGLTKQLWTKTQLGLRETATAFDRLTADGIPFIVFKGGAQYAEGLAVTTRRIMGDVDILVRPEDTVRALDSLASDHWTATNGESFEYLRELANVRLSGNFKKGEHGEIDLHNSPFHFARIQPALDEAMWRSAAHVKLALRPILVPAPTDATLLLLAHSATSNSGDWAIDLATRIERQSIDWALLASMAHQRGLVPACLAGLRYVRQELSLGVPDAALAALAALPVPAGERLKYWSNVRDRSERNLFEKAGNRLADRLLRHQGFSLIVKDRRAITVTRPRIPFRWLLGLAKPVEELPAGRALLHTLTLGEPRKSLILKLTLAAPSMSRRLFFDITCNGVAIARLRSRAGGRGAGREVSRTFQLPLPNGLVGDVSVQISARPVRFIPPDGTEREIAALAPTPFNLAGAWTT